MPSSESSLPDDTFRARKAIFEEVAEERHCLESLHLEAARFPQAVRGFALLERSEGHGAFRWMATCARFVLHPEVDSFLIEARSEVPGNRVTIYADGQELREEVVSQKWTAITVSLPPGSRKPRHIRISAEKQLEAPGDDRELALMVRRFEFGERPPSELAATGEPGTPVPFLVQELPPIPSPEAQEVPAHPETTPRAVIAQKFLRPRDAMSHEAIAMASLLEAEGWEVSLLAEEVHPEMSGRVTDADALVPALQDSSTLLILHHGTYWEYGEALFRNAGVGRKLLRYHNVTPPEHFLDHPSGYLEPTLAGRYQTTSLLAYVDLALAPSHWALGDLMASGARPEQLAWLPFLHDLDLLDTIEPDPALEKELAQRDAFQILVLGRQVPSKGLHHALANLAAFRSRYSEALHLWIVGSQDSLLASYADELRSLVRRHDLGDAVTFRPEADRRAVVTYLRGCDALLTMSESDAACIPILEAGWFGKPILGLARGGKSESAGPGQLLFDSLDPELHAASWHQLAANPALAGELGSRAREHVRTRFGPESILIRFRELVASPLRGRR